MTSPEFGEAEREREIRGWEEEEDNPTDQQLGRRVKLNPPTIPSTGGYALAQGTSSDVVWCLFKKPRHATLVLQTTTPQAAASSGGFAPPGVNVTVTTSIGGSATFTQQFFLPPGPTIKVRVFGRRIQVSAFLSGTVGSSPTTHLEAAIVTEDVDPLGELVTQWVPAYTVAANALITPNGQGLTSQGYFLGCQGFMAPSGTAGQTYYLMVFDLAPGTALSNGLVPLVAIGPLVSGTAFSFDRSLRPSVRFVNGLQWALSTTPAVLTQVVDSAVARVDADYGV